MLKLALARSSAKTPDWLHRRGECQVPAAPGSDGLVRRAAAEEMQHDAPDTREYSWQMKALSLVSTTVVLLVFVAVLAGATRLWAAWLALFGSRRVRRPSLGGPRRHARRALGAVQGLAAHLTAVTGMHSPSRCA